MVQRRLLELFVCPRCGEGLAPVGDRRCRRARRTTWCAPTGTGSPATDGYLDLTGQLRRRRARRPGPSRASATSGTPSTTCATRTPSSPRSISATSTWRLAGGQDRARRRMRQGPLHALSRPASRRARRPGRLERGGGGGAQPRAVPQRPRGEVRPPHAPRRGARQRRRGRVPRGAASPERSPAPGSPSWCGCWRPGGGSSSTSTAGRHGRGPGRWRWPRPAWLRTLTVRLPHRAAARAERPRGGGRSTSGWSASGAWGPRRGSGRWPACPWRATGASRFAASSSTPSTA